MKKRVLNFYMEKSSKLVLLNLFLGIMELRNNPWKFSYFIVPVGAYAVGFHYRSYLEFPFIPDKLKAGYDICIDILLLCMFIMFILAIIATIGRNLHDKESEIFREAFEGKKENKQAIHLLYKRKKGENITRKIYSHTTLNEWNDKAVISKILQVIDEHIVLKKFTIDDKNSRIIVLITRKGFNKPKREKYIDDELNRELEGVKQ